jgi:hypothetical protein
MTAVLKIRFCLVLISVVLFSQNCFADEITKVNQVGPVKVTTTLTPRSPMIGDEIQLRIKVQFPHRVEVLMPEFGEALSHFSILDFVPRKKIESDGNNIETQKYTLQPATSGAQSITPILVEFIDNRPGKQATPKDADAYEILTDRIDFVVQSVLPSRATNDLKPPLGKLHPAREMTTFQTAWLVLAVLLVLAFAVGLWFYLQARGKRGVRRSAYEIARRKLDHLLSTGTPSSQVEAKVFFVSISAIIRKYLEDRFDMQAPELTTEEFLTLASKSRELSNSHQNLLRGFLKQADLVKFAGVRASADEIEGSQDAAVRFLEDTKENAPFVQAPIEYDGDQTHQQRETADV